MRSLKTYCSILLCFIAAVAIGCSAGAEDETGEGIQATGKAYWSVDSVSALDELHRNADGHARYYILEGLLPGQSVSRVSLDAEGTYITMTISAEAGAPVEFFVIRMTEDLEDVSGFSEMEVDGRTYYYQESHDEETGEFSYSYFQWVEEGLIFLVHPQEPVTPEVIRKYNQVKKVEFNIGRKAVGLGTGVPLIADLNKKKALVRANKGIHYHTGQISPETHDDLLQP